MTNYKVLALELFHVLHVNKLHYSYKYLAWVRVAPESNELVKIKTEDIVRYSSLFLSGITKERANDFLTSLLIAIIQGWVIKSPGKVVKIFNADIGAIRFIPASLQNTYPKILPD